MVSTRASKPWAGDFLYDLTRAREAAKKNALAWLRSGKFHHPRQTVTRQREPPSHKNCALEIASGQNGIAQRRAVRIASESQ